MSSVPPATVQQTQTQLTVTAHPSHWHDVLTAILKAVSAVNPIIATFIPAPVEEGIQISTAVVPTVLNAIEANEGNK
jgi:hypothetical protein